MDGETRGGGSAIATGEVKIGPPTQTRPREEGGNSVTHPRRPRAARRPTPPGGSSSGGRRPPPGRRRPDRPWRAERSTRRGVRDDDDSPREPEMGAAGRGENHRLVSTKNSLRGTSESLEEDAPLTHVAPAFSPPRRGCEHEEGTGASTLAMAHVFVIGAAAGAMGSIVGASPARAARARRFRHERLFPRPPPVPPVAIEHARAEHPPTPSPPATLSPASRFSAATRRASETARSFAIAPSSRTRTRLTSALSLRLGKTNNDDAPRSSSRRSSQSKSRGSTARRRRTRTASTTPRRPRSAPSARRTP